MLTYCLCGVSMFVCGWICDYFLLLHSLVLLRYIRLMDDNIRMVCLVCVCCSVRSYILVQRVDNRFAIGQLAHLHRTVGAAREQPTVAVHLQLRDALANVLEEAAARMFAGE